MIIHPPKSMKKTSEKNGTWGRIDVFWSKHLPQPSDHNSANMDDPFGLLDSAIVVD